MTLAAACADCLAGLARRRSIKWAGATHNAWSTGPRGPQALGLTASPPLFFREKLGASTDVPGPSAHPEVLPP